MSPCGWCLRFSLACHCPSKYAHTYSKAGIFFCFLTALHPTLGFWYTGSCGFSSPLGLPTFAMGSPLRGRGLLVLDRNEGLVSPIGSGKLGGSWLAIPPLSVGICAPCQGVLPDGPQCVLTVGLPLALSRVLHGPLLGVWDVFHPLPSFLPAGVGASVGCSALRPAAACPLFSGCTSLSLVHPWP